MTRKQLLSELYKEYDNIYEFTGNFGDEPLNILDQFLIEAGLSTENEYIWDEKLADGLRFLNNETLEQLIQVYKDVVQECKVELQD